MNKKIKRPTKEEFEKYILMKPINELTPKEIEWYLLNQCYVIILKDEKISELNNIINDVQTYLKDYDYNSLKDESKIMLTNINAIIDGTIKIVK